MGKLSLVGGCSSIPVFDGSVGSVSSLRSLYSQVRQGRVLYRLFFSCSMQDLSDSFDTISEDNFLSSLEDEI